VGLNAEDVISLKDTAHAHYDLSTLKRFQPILQLNSSIPNQALSTSTAVTIGQFQALN
jgi:hypothetical protein